GFKISAGQSLIRSRMTGTDLETARSAQMAMGHFPHGNVGTLVYNEMSSAVEQFAGRVEGLQEKSIGGPFETQIDIGEFNLLIRVPRIYKSGLVQHRYAKQRAQDILSLWIYHLAFSQVARDNWPRTSTMVFKDSIWQFGPVEQPRSLLTELIAMFKIGLEQPLHLFPGPSLEYVQQQINGRSEKAALHSARLKWTGNDYARGESDDPYIDICYKSTDPLDASFARISEAVFGPLLANGNPVITLR
ncbi:MAG: hypothetical protein R3274_07555, partial [Desulfobacterales bacterium]|nr:hypothetical protein [Desulfobacterales bacterium]